MVVIFLNIKTLIFLDSKYDSESSSAIDSFKRINAPIDDDFKITQIN
jgi:hypothetical protein